MCLIVFAWHVVPGLPLIAAANRDEFDARPSAPAQWWADFPEVYAGRDLDKAGTWMGVTRTGRFAAVTNFRSAEPSNDAPCSRGKLVADFLTGAMTSDVYLQQIEHSASDYNGFNLLFGDRHQLIWYSNRAQHDPRNGRPIQPGIYGQSNAHLDTPWPKVVRTKAEFASLLCQCASEEAFFEMLTDTRPTTDCRLPKTGLPIELERALSAVCIDTKGYGTRVSTVVQLDGHDGASLVERTLR